MTPELSIVVPCYNEAAALPGLLEEFAAASHGCDFELILVDNGSVDDTEKLLSGVISRFPFARRLKVSPNRGYGGGILAGLAEARGRFAGWTHADGQFPAAAAFEALRRLKERPGPALAKGARLGRPAADRFFTSCLSVLYTVLLGEKLYDMSGQPTVFSSGLLDGLAPPEDFSLDAFALAAALKKNWKVERFGVELRPRGSGASSWNRGACPRLRLALRYLAAVPGLRAALRRAGG